jgi:hypothetical protein
MVTAYFGHIQAQFSRNAVDRGRSFLSWHLEVILTKQLTNKFVIALSAIH